MRGSAKVSIAALLIFLLIPALLVISSKRSLDSDFAYSRAAGLLPKFSPGSRLATTAGSTDST